MTTSDNLFELIKALSKSEKRYFKLFSSLQKGEKTYLKLFDSIEKQTRAAKYNEKKLIIKFKQEGVKTSFWMLKNYLYRQVLKAMESYHTSTYSEVHTMFHHAQFLHSKELYRQAKMAINKAKELAVKNELYETALSILRFENRIPDQRSDIDWHKRIRKEEKRGFYFLQNTNTYRYLSDEIYFHYTNYGTVREKKHLKAIEKIMARPALYAESKAKTPSAKIFFHQIHGLYNFLTGDHKRAYSHTYSMFVLYQKYPHKKKQIGSYMAFLSNLCVTAMGIKKYHDIRKYLHEFQAMESFKKSESEKTLLFFHHTYNLLRFMNKTGQFTEVEVKLPEIIKQHNQYENKLNKSQKILLFSNIAIVCFGAEKYKSCLLWLNRIKNEIPGNVLPDVEASLHLLYLISNYEVGHEDVLPYQIQSAYRFMRQQKQLYQFEKIIINFFKTKLPLVNSHEELTCSFKKLKLLLLPLTSDPYEKNAFEYFDYISWLESKIENRPFAEIVRGKVK